MKDTNMGSAKSAAETMTAAVENTNVDKENAAIEAENAAIEAENAAIEAENATMEAENAAAAGAAGTTGEEGPEGPAGIPDHVIDMLLGERINIEPLSICTAEAIETCQNEPDTDEKPRHDTAQEVEILERIGARSSDIENAMKELANPLIRMAVDASLRMIFDNVCRAKRSLAGLTADIVGSSVDDARAQVLIGYLSEMMMAMGELLAAQSESTMHDNYRDVRIELREETAGREAEYEKTLEECDGDETAAMRKLMIAGLSEADMAKMLMNALMRGTSAVPQPGE